MFLQIFPFNTKTNEYIVCSILTKIALILRLNLFEAQGSVVFLPLNLASHFRNDKGLEAIYCQLKLKSLATLECNLQKMALLIKILATLEIVRLAESL
jgi:hypothetical protein